MRALRFHRYGHAPEVLGLENLDVPEPGLEQIRVTVEACGLTPADWALCEGLVPGELPRGIGLEVSGIVSAIGADVHGVEVGDAVFGPATFDGPSGGASEEAILDLWALRPAGLCAIDAAALPMAVETAFRALDELGVQAGFTGTVLVHGAGSTVGFAAVQMAIEHGARVIATAGRTYAASLQDLGAQVTSYEHGMTERVLALAAGRSVLALDAAPAGRDQIDDLVTITGSPKRLLTISNFESARRVGARVSLGTNDTLRHDVLERYGALTAAGKFRIPIARTMAFERWREAVEVSVGGNARGKLILEIESHHH